MRMLILPVIVDDSEGVCYYHVESWDNDDSQQVMAEDYWEGWTLDDSIRLLYYVEE